jgi:hypothetical protein
MAKEYRMEEMVDVDLYARKDIPVFKANPFNEGAKPFTTIRPPALVGFVYSYITGPQGQLVWMFKPRADFRQRYGVEYFYATHRSSAFRVPEGIKTYQEKLKEADEAAKTWEDQLKDGIKTVSSALVNLVIAGIAIWGVVKLSESEKER